ncbi:hypothetical protein K435DRAFT_851689 [Dendrothele bispora CBS 962.96]|uniref:Uncharacterized protein n=1 Tax=Dendrothele bispora (strain CBS 962.96) TaxID=1314807 RepID=A0A4S8ML54_DENBC|nr:hypothetical protein K435DRAFT_851689 [Dendrothele bispora CBS 962.96]
MSFHVRFIESCDEAPRPIPPNRNLALPTPKQPNTRTNNHEDDESDDEDNTSPKPSQSITGPDPTPTSIPDTNSNSEPQPPLQTGPETPRSRTNTCTAQTLQLAEQKQTERLAWQEGEMSTMEDADTSEDPQAMRTWFDEVLVGTEEGPDPTLADEPATLKEALAIDDEKEFWLTALDKEFASI